MGIDASLADQAQFRQPTYEAGPQWCALTHQNECFDVADPFSQFILVARPLVPHGDVVAGQLSEAGQRAQRVEIVVENVHTHRLPLLW